MTPSSTLSDPHPVSRRDETTRLFAEAGRAVNPVHREALLTAIVTVNRAVAITIAGRYRGRGLSEEDLQQTACVGLIHAVHRFDAELGHGFLSFAVPTIRGELRRAFRDHGWFVRPPRRVQELQGRLHQTTAELSQQLQRDPTDGELAEALGIDRTELARVQSAYGASRPTSLDLPVGAASDHTLGDRLPDPSASGVILVETRLLLEPVLSTLSEEDRRIIAWRFWGDLTQKEIGARLSLTQVQVSRRLRRILDQLGAALSEVA